MIIWIHLTERLQVWQCGFCVCVYFITHFELYSIVAAYTLCFGWTAFKPMFANDVSVGFISWLRVILYSPFEAKILKLVHISFNSQVRMTTTEYINSHFYPDWICNLGYFTYGFNVFQWILCKIFWQTLHIVGFQYFPFNTFNFVIIFHIFGHVTYYLFQIHMSWVTWVPRPCWLIQIFYRSSGIACCAPKVF